MGGMGITSTGGANGVTFSGHCDTQIKLHLSNVRGSMHTYMQIELPFMYSTNHCVVVTT